MVNIDVDVSKLIHNLKTILSVFHAIILLSN